MAGRTNLNMERVMSESVGTAVVGSIVLGPLVMGPRDVPTLTEAEMRRADRERAKAAERVYLERVAKEKESLAKMQKTIAEAQKIVTSIDVAMQEEEKVEPYGLRYARVLRERRYCLCGKRADVWTKFAHPYCAKCYLETHPELRYFKDE